MVGEFGTDEWLGRLILEERMARGLSPYDNGGCSGTVITLFVCLLVSFVCSYLGKRIGGTRGRPTAGFWFGFFLGPIGWILVLLLPREGRRCPHCCEVVADAATVCPHCQREIALPRPAPKPQPPTQPKAQAPKITKVLVSCPNCGARYNVPSVKLGYNFRCLKCGTTFTSMPES